MTNKCVTFAALAVIGLASVPSADAYTEKALYSFCSAKNCKDGSNSASNGGKHSAGVVFEFVPSTGQYTVLHNFCSQSGCKDGSQPERVNLVIDVNGNLYGTTAKGGNSQDGGVVFELVRTDSGWHEHTLYMFCSKITNCTDGQNPYDGLTYAGAASGQPYDGVSPLFGTTLDGENVFSVTPGLSKTWTEQVLYTFCSKANCVDGFDPNTPLTIDAAGNIYGTTLSGGDNNAGVVFELSPSGSTYSETVLYSFCAQQNCTDGFEPTGGVVFDGSGNMFGTADGGGSDNDGLVFELSVAESQWRFTDLANFSGADGRGPFGALLFFDGNLFGTTATGGTNLAGNVFEFDGSLESLYSFCSQTKCRDGKETTSGVVRDASGNFYGVTTQGGTHKSGTIYQLSP